MRLGDTAGLSALAQHRLTVAGDKGANTGAKITSLVAGWSPVPTRLTTWTRCMHRLFTRIYAPSTLGAFLRAFTFGHVRQLDAVTSRFLTCLADHATTLVPTGSTRSLGRSTPT